jgi:holo-[acyl-carrier protein] synthase
MIFGIGTDIVQLARIEQVHEKFGERFVERLLLPAELAAFQEQKRPLRFLAMRFAAKEAIVKAMGTGFAHGMWIRDTGVVSNAWGKPQIVWSERGRRVCDELGIGEGHVTLSDEAGLVVAVAVLMRK